MRLLISTIICMLSFNLYAFSENTAYLSKTFKSGYTSVENMSSLSCTIFSDRAVIEKSSGPLKFVEEKTIELTGPLNELIKKIKNSPRENKVGPTDSATTTYKIHWDMDGFDDSEIFLQTGEKIIYTKTAEARLVKKFIDKVCD